MGLRALWETKVGSLEAPGSHSGSSTEVLVWCPAIPRLFQAIMPECCHSPAGSLWAHSHLPVLPTASSQDGGRKNIPKPIQLAEGIRHVW